MSSRSQVGTIGWIDLTVPDASSLRDFYHEVVGWSSSEVAMGEYADFCMHPDDESAPVAGICHAIGLNADLPSQWLIYIVVADLEVSLARCVASGGAVLVGPRAAGSAGRYAVIRDPAGAIAALYASVEILTPGNPNPDGAES